MFKGVGKLKDYQLKIHIDPKVKPISQKARRLPFSIRDKVKKKLDELEKLDIIERVEGPSAWISPAVVILKHNSEDIRLCTDMR